MKMSIYAFKVKDYTTVLLGQKEVMSLAVYVDEKDRYQTSYYVQRGDGIKYSYHQNSIEWVKFLGEFEITE
jgi:hypothetical protein